MGELLGAFDRAFEGAVSVALPAALAWGVASVVLSPCHLSSIPLVVAYMSGGDALPTGRRAALLSTAFALGILLSTGAVGGVTVAAGRMLGDVGRAGNVVLAALFFAMGLHLLGRLPLPAWSTPTPGGRRGAAGAALLGLLFGAALGPCTFAFLAPLLALALRAGAREATLGALLVGAFAVGHALAIVAAGTSAQGVQRWLSSKVGARATAGGRRLAGVAVLLGGVYFLVANL